MSRPHYIKEVAESLLEEMRATAESVAEQLAPPADAFDGRDVQHGRFIEWWQRQSLTELGAPASVDPMTGIQIPAEPSFMQKELDRLAPKSIPLPDGRMLRAYTGLKNYIALVKEARPDLYAAVGDLDG